MGFQLFVFCIANIFSSFSSEFVHGPYLLELFILQVKKPTQKRRSIDWKSKVSSRLLCFNDWKNQGSFLLSTVYSSSKAVLNFTVLLGADCRFSRFQVTTPHCVGTDFHGPSEMSEELLSQMPPVFGDLNLITSHSFWSGPIHEFTA